MLLGCPVAAVDVRFVETDELFHASKAWLVAELSQVVEQVARGRSAALHHIVSKVADVTSMWYGTTAALRTWLRRSSEGAHMPSAGPSPGQSAEAGSTESSWHHRSWPQTLPPPESFRPCIGR